MRNERGVSLIELLLVIVLVGILAVVAIPRLGLGGFDAAAGANELTQAIRYAQTMSMTQGGEQRFSVRIDTGGYAVQRLQAPDYLTIAKPFADQGPYRNDAASWQGITLSRTGRIAFDARGRPDCSGDFNADCSNATIRLSHGNTQVDIVLEPITGYVR